MIVVVTDYIINQKLITNNVFKIKNVDNSTFFILKIIF